MDVTVEVFEKKYYSIPIDALSDEVGYFCSIPIFKIFHRNVWVAFFTPDEEDLEALLEEHERENP